MGCGVLYGGEVVFEVYCDDSVEFFFVGVGDYLVLYDVGIVY